MRGVGFSQTIHLMEKGDVLKSDVERNGAVNPHPAAHTSVQKSKRFSSQEGVANEKLLKKKEDS